VDRYQLSHAFQNEQIRRSIVNCTSLDELKVMSLKLLEMCQAQKAMIGQMMLPPGH
jgi:hypothetical protein